VHVAGGWLVVEYRGLCSQAQTYQVPKPGEGVIFSVDQHLPLASINAAR